MMHAGARALILKIVGLPLVVAAAATAALPQSSSGAGAEGSGQAMSQALQPALLIAQEWIAASFERAPALAFGLAALLAVPPLALIGLAIKRRERFHRTQLVRHRPQAAVGDPREKFVTGRAPVPVKRAAFDVDQGRGVEHHAVVSHFLRIGREQDNDICLSDMTVHRYHAAVHRTEEGDYVITDLSSLGGNGVAVNGRTVTEARLNYGDAIELGRVKLKFVSHQS